MTPEADRVNDYRVLVLPPTRRDGEATRQALEHAGSSVKSAQIPARLPSRLARASGALILTDALAATQAPMRY